MPTVHLSDVLTKATHFHLPHGRRCVCLTTSYCLKTHFVEVPLSRISAFSVHRYKGAFIFVVSGFNRSQVKENKIKIVCFKDLESQ